MATQERSLKTKHYTISDGPSYTDFSSASRHSHSASIQFRTSNDEKFCAKVASYDYRNQTKSKVFIRGYTGYFRAEYWHPLWPFTAEYDFESRSGQLAISGNRIVHAHPATR